MDKKYLDNSGLTTLIFNIFNTFAKKDHSHGVDYIVEQGTSNGWYYRKWNNGNAECWISKTYDNVEMTQTWGQLYESSDSYYLTYPFTFKEKPCYVITPTEADGGVLSTEIEAYDATTSRTGRFRFCKAVSKTASVSCSCFVFGKWK